MSSQRVRKIKNPAIQYTATWAANVLTVVTTSANNVVVGDIIQLISNNVPQVLSGAVVSVISTTSFTIAASSAFSGMIVGDITTDFFRTGQTGRKIIALPRNSGNQGTIFVQSYVSGVGGASYSLEVSLDGIHWIPMNTTLTHPTTDQDTQYMPIDAWAYFAANIITIGASTRLDILVSV